MYVFAVDGVAALLCVGIAVGVGVVAGAVVVGAVLAGGALDVVGGGTALVGAAALLDSTTERAAELAADLAVCGARTTAMVAPSGATLPAL